MCEMCSELNAQQNNFNMVINILYFRNYFYIFTHAPDTLFTALRPLLKWDGELVFDNGLDNLSPACLEVVLGLGIVLTPFSSRSSVARSQAFTATFAANYGHLGTFHDHRIFTYGHFHGRISMLFMFRRFKKLIRLTVNAVRFSKS
jgi:hypothetical protein